MYADSGAVGWGYLSHSNVQVGAQRLDWHPQPVSYVLPVIASSTANRDGNPVTWEVTKPRTRISAEADCTQLRSGNISRMARGKLSDRQTSRINTRLRKVAYASGHSSETVLSEEDNGVL